MTTELAPRPLSETVSLGALLAESGYFADTKEAAQAVVKVLAGRELGFGPIASMTGISIVKGRVTLGANLIAAAIKRSGRYDFRVSELTNERCRIAFYDRLRGDGVVLGESVFTMQDAQRAKIAGGDNWRTYPRNMLFARAISNGAKWFCPDVFGGPVYTPDELGGDVDIDADAPTWETPPDAEPEPDDDDDKTPAERLRELGFSDAEQRLMVLSVVGELREGESLDDVYDRLTPAQRDGMRETVAERLGRDA